MSVGTGLLASYEYLDSTVDAITGLRRAGFEVKAYAPYPDHHIEHALGYDQSPVRVWTLVGGLTGTATALAFTTWTSVDWPIVVGGKPIVSIPPYVIIMFELTVLFGALWARIANSKFKISLEFRRARHEREGEWPLAQMPRMRSAPH